MAKESCNKVPIKFIEFSLEISLVGEDEEVTNNKLEEFCQFIEKQVEIENEKGENRWEICGTSVYDEEKMYLRSLTIIIMDSRVIPEIIELVKKFASENGVELGFRS